MTVRMDGHRFEFYDTGLPGVDLSELQGRLIVIEGPDGVGRSTQIALLKPWLEANGHAVLDTGMTRSALAGKGIKQAKAGITLGPVSLTLFYATDFADRLENQMIPALRAGFIVLTDRYIYSLIARGIVRGLDPTWIKSFYGLALKPDSVFYLRASVPDLIPRVLGSPTGFDYWESGMDMHFGRDLFDSFVAYQTRMLGVFDSLAEEYKFEVIDATQRPEIIYRLLQRRIGQLLRRVEDRSSES
ncbi:MAG TPA: thymidylate kinase [Blastocatellia bacterium]|nr:thymidylate kinase [Blastocatellia bacterium]